jgi:hypothetical protein
MWTRWLTVPLAALQSFSMISLLRSQNILADITPFTTVVIVLSATAGTVFLMWLGELITEEGLGNGVSMLIFAGIVAALPTGASRLLATWDPSQFFTDFHFRFLRAKLGTEIRNVGNRQSDIVGEHHRLRFLDFVLELRELCRFLIACKGHGKDSKKIAGPDVRETSEEHGTGHQAGAGWALLYSSGGLTFGLGPNASGLRTSGSIRFPGRKSMRNRHVSSMEPCGPHSSKRVRSQCRS